MPTTPPSLTPSPQQPQRGVRSTFSNFVDAFVTWMVNAVAQFGALATNVFNNATEAFNSATAAAGSAETASTKASEAAISAASAYDSIGAAAAAAGAPPWASGTTYQQFQTAASRVNFKVYRKTSTAAVNTGGAIDPANDPSNWQIAALAHLHRSPRTSNTMLGNSDTGAFIDITAGTFTQTFNTPANLANGWFCYIRNSGTGNVTIPSSDGRTNWIMYPGEVRLFQCDGSSLTSIVLVAYRLTSQVSGTWIKPPGYNYHRVRETGSGAGGGGGGGGGSGTGTTSWTNGGDGGGGGAGGSPGVTTEAVFPDSFLPTSVAFTVGAAGSGGAGGIGGAGTTPGVGGNAGTNGAAGGTGNPSSFGSPGAPWYVTAAGGVAGLGGGGGTNGNVAGAGANNTTATSFTVTATGAYSLPTSAPGSSLPGGLHGNPTPTSGPGGPGGTGGNGGASYFTSAALTGGSGGAAISTLGVPGNDGASPANRTEPGTGGPGGGGGGGSAGCGQTSNAATAKGGNGGRGADGGPGQTEISGII